MITKSFIFLEGIGSQGEERIWKQGVFDWHTFLRCPKIKGISDARKSYYDRKIREAQHALRKSDSTYFVGKLPSTEMWRLYESFNDECNFLDIEVDSYGSITLVGISNYYQTSTLVRGFNLSAEEIGRHLQKCKLLITFNGSSFDLPKLQKEFKISLTIPHLDLKPLCVKLGLKGGLKKIESVLNLGRPRHLLGSPVDLWKAFHASGDREYLDLLIAYNCEDIENLKRVADFCSRQMKLKIASRSAGRINLVAR